MDQSTLPINNTIGARIVGAADNNPARELTEVQMTSYINSLHQLTPAQKEMMMQKLSLKDDDLSSFNTSGFTGRYEKGMLVFFAYLLDYTGFELTDMRYVNFEMIRQILMLLTSGNRLGDARSEQGTLIANLMPSAASAGMFAFLPCYCPDAQGIDSVEQKNEMAKKKIIDWLFVTKMTEVNGGYKATKLNYFEFACGVEAAMIRAFDIKGSFLNQKILVKQLAYSLASHVLHMNELYGSTKNNAEEKRRAIGIARRELLGLNGVYSDIVRELDSTVHGMIAIIEQVCSYMIAYQDTMLKKASTMKDGKNGKYRTQDGWREGGYCATFPPGLETSALRMRDSAPDLWDLHFHGGIPKQWRKIASIRSCFTEYTLSMGTKTRNPSCIPLQFLKTMVARVRNSIGVTGSADVIPANLSKVIDDFFKKGDFIALRDLVGTGTYANAFPTATWQVDILGLMFDIGMGDVQLSISTAVWNQIVGPFCNNPHSRNDYTINKHLTTGIRMVGNVHPGYGNVKRGTSGGSKMVNGLNGLHLPLERIKGFKADLQKNMNTMQGGFQQRMQTATERREWTQEIQSVIGTVVKITKVGGAKVYYRDPSLDWMTMNSMVKGASVIKEASTTKAQTGRERVRAANDISATATTLACEYKKFCGPMRAHIVDVGPFITALMKAKRIASGVLTDKIEEVFRKRGEAKIAVSTLFAGANFSRNAWVIALYKNQKDKVIKLQLTHTTNLGEGMAFNDQEEMEDEEDSSSTNTEANPGEGMDQTNDMGNLFNSPPIPLNPATGLPSPIIAPQSFAAPPVPTERDLYLRNLNLAGSKYAEKKNRKATWDTATLKQKEDWIRSERTEFTAFANPSLDIQALFAKYLYVMVDNDDASSVAGTEASEVPLPNDPLDLGVGTAYDRPANYGNLYAVLGRARFTDIFGTDQVSELAQTAPAGGLTMSLEKFAANRSNFAKAFQKNVFVAIFDKVVNSFTPEVNVWCRSGYKKSGRTVTAQVTSHLEYMKVLSLPKKMTVKEARELLILTLADILDVPDKFLDSIVLIHKKMGVSHTGRTFVLKAARITRPGKETGLATLFESQNMMYTA